MIRPVIQYSIHQNPPRQNGGPAGCHLRVHRRGDIDTAGLSCEVGSRENQLFSEGVILGVLTDLADWLAEYLAGGYAVTLNGIGTFTPHVDGNEDGSGLCVGDIVFTPSDALLARINAQTRFERVAATRRTAVTDAEVTAFLDVHFASHQRLQRHHVEQHFHLSKRRALSLITRLVNDGRLRPAPGTTTHTAAYVSGSVGEDVNK